MNNTYSIFSRRSPETIPPLISPFIHMPDNIETFYFDACEINECFVLKNIVGYFYKKFIDNSKIEVDETNLSKFISLVCDNYNHNYYHNFRHAVNVLQMSYLLLKETNILKKLKPIILFAVLISSLSHDVGHPGNTNSYEINSMSKYAILYNDISVLENYHCSLTFKLLEISGLLKSFKHEDFKILRKTIISCILGTDMSKHNDHLNKLSTIDFNVEEHSIEEQITIASIFVHYADLSNSIKQFEYSLEWSQRISLEFYEQTLKEELEGLPVLPFMKVNDKYSISLNEISYINNISIPMWDLFVEKFTNMSFILIRVNETLSKWKEIENSCLLENNINIDSY